MKKFNQFLSSIKFLVQLGAAAALTIPACISSAQVLTTLHSFDNSDGANPVADLLLWSNVLYGTTYYGGSASNGTVFKVNVDGTGFQSLHSFITSNGINPAAGLIVSNTILTNAIFFGTAAHGGVSSDGVVYRINWDGSGYSVLHSFSGSDGSVPLSRLAQTNQVLFGTTYLGGTNNKGTVFKINEDGTSFSTLHQFSGADGEFPAAGLALAPGTNVLYGTTEGNFSTIGGTVFRINTDGSLFTTLHTFAATNGSEAEVLYSDGTLYGTTVKGGTSGDGTVFSMNASGSGFTTLLNMTEPTGTGPISDLILDGDTLYGTAALGGADSVGTVFSMNTDGAGFTTLWNFQALTDGKAPSAGLVISNETLYGTTISNGLAGGTGFGTVFSLNLGCDAWDWWKGDSNMLDSVGTNNGTAVGTVNYVPAYSCFGFALTNASIDFGTNAGNFGTNNFEIDLWLATTASNKQDILGKRPNCGYANMWDLLMNTNGTVTLELCQDWVGTYYSSLTSVGRVNDGKLHEVTAIREGTVLYLYLDGYLDTNGLAAAVVGVTNGAQLVAASGPCVGQDGTSNFVGVLDEIKLMPVCPCLAPTWDLWKGESNTLDSVGVNNGVATGALTYTTGATDCSGHAFKLSGVTNYIDFGTNAGNFGTTNFVIDFWMKTTNTTQLEGVLGKRSTCNLCNSWDIRLEASGTIAFAICQDTSGTYHTTFVSETPLNDGAWHEVTLIRRGAVIALYVDGTLDSQVNTTGIVNIDNTAHLYAGKSACTGVDGTEYFTGDLDEIKLMGFCY